MTPLPDEDDNTAGRWDDVYRFHPGTAVTHTMNHYPDNGPPFCQECSDAAANWVRWPCNDGGER